MREVTRVIQHEVTLTLTEDEAHALRCLIYNGIPHAQAELRAISNALKDAGIDGSRFRFIRDDRQLPTVTAR